MRKFVLMLSTVMLGSTALMASWGDMFSGCCPDMAGACTVTDWPSPINVDAGIGYRKDKFQWSKAGPGRDPDILSELKWKNLNIIEIGGKASYVSCRNYAVRVWGNYGHIYHGTNIDSDFFGRRRSHLFSRSVNDAGKGHVYDAAAAVGYRITSTCNRFVGMPFVGYSDHAQYLYIFGGNEVFSLGLEPLGPFKGLNSKYKTRWFGPVFGIEGTAQVEKCAYLFGSFEWHIMSYRAEGCWNLRPDLGSFHHKAHGFGYLATLGGNWEICGNWSIGIVGSYRMFRTRHGVEKVTFRDPIFGESRGREHFNGAEWHTISISGIVAWRF